MEIIFNIAIYLFRKACNKMFISLLSLFVRHDWPATIGLNLRSLGFGISMYSDFSSVICFI